MNGQQSWTTVVIVLVVVLAVVFAFLQYQEQQRLARQRTLGGGIGQLGAGIGEIVDSVYSPGG